MKKKILIFTRCSWTYVNFRKDLIEKIDTQKFITHIVFDKTNYRFKKKDNIKYHHIPFLNPGNSLFRNLSIMYKIFILILETKPDIIHKTYYNYNLKKQYKSKVVLTVFDLWHEKNSKTFYRPKEYSLSISDHIVCPSISTKNDLFINYT